MALSRVLPGWTQDDSYRIRRSGRAERGVLAYSPAWSELSKRTGRGDLGKASTLHGCRRTGTGERKREPPGGNAWYLYSPAGFAPLI